MDLTPKAVSETLHVVYERPGAALVAESEGLVVGIDLDGLTVEGGLTIVDTLAKQRTARPRPAPLVNLIVVGEDAPRPNEDERQVGRRMAEYHSLFVCVIEGNSVRAQWVRGILGAISAFAPRRNRVLTARTIAEGAALAARELGRDRAAIADAITGIRRRLGP